MMRGHKPVASKYRKTWPFLRHQLLSRHIPETCWYNSESMMKTLAKYRVVFLKPDTGSLGRGIIRLANLAGSECEIRWGASTEILPMEKTESFLKGVMERQRKYIIQQGITLATFQGCPFDMRIVLQRPYQTWQLSLTSAKVALRPDAIVTNVARGAKDYPLTEILSAYDQVRDPMAMLREVIDLAHQGASLLGAEFPIRIIGFDMAVDINGKLWFLEANTRPQCAQCKLVNDVIAVRKFEEAMAVISS